MYPLAKPYQTTKTSFSEDTFLLKGIKWLLPAASVNYSFWKHQTPKNTRQSCWKSQSRLAGNDMLEGSIKVDQRKGWANATERPRTPVIYWSVAWCIYSFLFLPLHYLTTWFSLELVRNCGISNHSSFTFEGKFEIYSS